MFYLDDLPDMSEYLGNKKSPKKGVGKYKLRLTPILLNVKYEPEMVDIVEHAESLNIGQLRSLIREVREEGFSSLASRLDMVLDEKLNWGVR